MKRGREQFEYARGKRKKLEKNKKNCDKKLKKHETTSKNAEVTQNNHRNTRIIERNDRTNQLKDKLQDKKRAKAKNKPRENKNENCSVQGAGSAGSVCAWLYSRHILSTSCDIIGRQRLDSIHSIVTVRRVRRHGTNNCRHESIFCPSIKPTDKSRSEMITWLFFVYALY